MCLILLPLLPLLLIPWKVVRIMFNANSVLVRVWFGAVLAGTYKYSQVPDLQNLRDEVGKKLIEIGYDIDNE